MGGCTVFIILIFFRLQYSIPLLISSFRSILLLIMDTPQELYLTYHDIHHSADKGSNERAREAGAS